MNTFESIIISPDVGFKNPPIILKVVVFPHPEGPNIDKNSPNSKSNKPNKTEYVSISHRQVKSALGRNFTPSNLKQKKNTGKINGDFKNSALVEF